MTAFYDKDTMGTYNRKKKYIRIQTFTPFPVNPL